MVQHNLNRLGVGVTLLAATKQNAQNLAVLLMMLIVAFAMVFPQAAQAESFVYRQNAKFPNGWQNGVEKANGLRVVWWNIECAEGKVKTSANLTKLVNTKKVQPDVIVLGEYCNDGLTSATRAALKKQGFVHEHWIKAYTSYHNGSRAEGDENGMRVFSKYPLTNVEKRRLPDINGFLGKDYMKQCKSKNGAQAKWFDSSYWKRPILDFDIVKNKKTYNLVAAHFAQPWAPAMSKCLGSNLQVGLKVLWGTHNPTYAQARTIANWYKGDTRTLVIGDFNAPKRFKKKVGPVTLTFTSNAYKRLVQGLGESDVKSAVGTGYAAGQSSSIDHAFASSDLRVNFAKVIPFAGSDHTALYTVIK